MARPADSYLPPDPDEPSALAHAAVRFAALADDLPFVPQSPYEPRRRQIAWRAGLLGVLAVAAFWPTLDGDWLWQDDRRILSDAALRTARGIGDIWAHPFAADAPPAARTLWWLQWRAFGPDSTAFRVVGLLLHWATAVFVWLALRRLNVTGAWLIVALFALHPATLPNVAWVSRQGDLLGAAFAAMAFHAWLVARRVQPDADERGWTDPGFNVDDDDHAPRWPWAVFALAAVVSIACASPVWVVAAVGLMILERRRQSAGGAADGAADGAAGQSGRRAIWATLVAFAVAGIAACLALPTGPPTAGPASAADAWGRVAWAETAAALPWSAFHAVVPIDGPFLYDRGQWAGPAWLWPAAGVTAVALALPWARRRVALIVLALAAALAVLHGLTAVRPGPAVLTADLLPYAVVLGLIAAALPAVLRRSRRALAASADRAVRWSAGVILLGLFGTLTFLRGPVYADADRLWQHTLAVNPDSVVARTELAARYVGQGYLEEAGIQLDRVPDAARDTRWLLARGRVYDAQKRYSDAATCYETAQRLNPADTNTIISLAEAYTQAGHPDRAASAYADLLARVPPDPGLFTNAGLAQMRLARPAAAVELYEKALALDARYVPAHVNLANALFELGRLDESAEHLQAVIRIDPRNFAAFMNAGVLLHRLNDPVRAERMFRAAISIDPKSAEAFADLGIVQAAQGKLAEAAWSFTQAVRIDPDHAAARHLGEVRRQLKAGPAATRASTTNHREAR